MSTSAQIEMMDYNDKPYLFYLYQDGYPNGVVPNLPDEKIDFEDVRRALQLKDDPVDMANYFYSISLADRTIEIYHADSSSTPWKPGELIFNGSFAEAKQTFRDNW